MPKQLVGDVVFPGAQGADGPLHVDGVPQDDCGHDQVITALQLALLHAPQVAPETVIAFGQAESRLNPLAIHDNEIRRSYAPASASEAVTLAHLLLADGGTVDLGLMQINSANLSRTGLTAASAFDPAEPVRVGGLSWSKRTGAVTTSRTSCAA
jgi:hypothetical protein